MDAYTTRRGTSRRRTPAADIYRLPSRDRRDDGAIILHVGDHLPVCTDCGRGHLQWAEAGYVPYHRICDTCGSHWDLHPLGMGVAFVPASSLAPETRVEPCAHCARDGAWCEWCEGGGQRTTIITSTDDAVRLCRWEDGTGWLPLTSDDLIVSGHDGAAVGRWMDLVPLITPEHLAAATTEQDRTMGVPCVSACWARRARFY